MIEIEYQCKMCGGTFLADNTDADAEAEFEERFGKLPEGEKMDVVCDTCYGRLGTLGYVPSPN